MDLPAPGNGAKSRDYSSTNSSEYLPDFVSEYLIDKYSRETDSQRKYLEDNKIDSHFYGGNKLS